MNLNGQLYRATVFPPGKTPATSEVEDILEKKAFPPLMWFGPWIVQPVASSILLRYPGS